MENRLESSIKYEPAPGYFVVEIPSTVFEKIVNSNLKLDEKIREAQIQTAVETYIGEGNALSVVAINDNTGSSIKPGDQILTRGTIKLEEFTIEDKTYFQGPTHALLGKLL